MSDWHGLTTRTNSRGREFAKVAFHIATPAFQGGTNAAGKDMATCLSEDDDHAKVSIVPGLVGQEVTDLASGNLVEVVAEVKLPVRATNAKRRSQINKEYRDQRRDLRDQLRSKYEFWGFTNDVGA